MLAGVGKSDRKPPAGGLPSLHAGWLPCRVANCPWQINPDEQLCGTCRDRKRVAQQQVPVSLEPWARKLRTMAVALAERKKDARTDLTVKADPFTLSQFKALRSRFLPDGSPLTETYHVTPVYPVKKGATPEYRFVVRSYEAVAQFFAPEYDGAAARPSKQRTGSVALYPSRDRGSPAVSVVLRQRPRPGLQGLADL